jgi:phenylacetate-CoA ligase
LRLGRRMTSSRLSEPSTQAPPVSFNRILTELKRHVPLYAQRWRNIDFAHFNCAEYAHFARLPILRKADLLATSVGDRLDDRFLNRRLTTDRTSGSTGQPLELLIDPGTKRRRSQRFLRALIGSGYRPGQRLMLISSRPSGVIKRISPWARLARWTYVDLYLGQDELVKEYQRVRPDLVYGPLNALNSLCDGLARSGNVTPERVRAISTAEQLTPQARRQLESVFAKGVTDFYGSTELGLVAWRSAVGNYYMTPQNDFLLEFLPLSEMPGFERLIVTDLAPGSMPLVRFDTGDLVRRGPTAHGIQITELMGREVDCLWLKTGRRVSPYALDGVLTGAGGVRHYRVIQREDYSVDVLIAAHPADVAALRKSLQDTLAQLCPDLPLAITFVEQLPLSTSNKARPIQSLVRMPP